MVIFQVKLGYPLPLSFLLDLFQKRPFKDKWHDYYGQNALAVTQPTVSQTHSTDPN